MWLCLSYIWIVTVLNLALTVLDVPQVAGAARGAGARAARRVPADHRHRLLLPGAPPTLGDAKVYEP